MRALAHAEPPLRPASTGVRRLGWAVLVLLALVPLVAGAFPYLPVLLVDVLVAALFAASIELLGGHIGILGRPADRDGPGLLC